MESSPSPVRSDGAATASLNARPHISGGLPYGEILSQLRCKLAPGETRRARIAKSRVAWRIQPEYFMGPCLFL